MKPHLAAGALAGVVGLVIFLVIHHLTILPIWFILPIGLPIAVAGGLAVGWAYAELGAYLPGRPGNTLAVIGLIWLLLLPALILAELRPPLFDVSGPESVLTVSVGRAAFQFVGELLLSAGLTGAVVGWLLGRSGRAALSLAVAGVVFALGPGHNIPFIGGTAGVLKELALMMAIIVPAAVALVEGERWLSARTAPLGQRESVYNTKV